jgi:hypothetical protein
LIGAISGENPCELLAVQRPIPGILRASALLGHSHRRHRR